MDIAERANDRSIKGDFMAEIKQGVLIVPADIKDMCSLQGLGNAEEFSGFVWAFPSGVMGYLNWTLDEVYSARDKLTNLLRGSIPDQYLTVPTTHAHFPLGARHPNQYRKP